MKGMKKIVGCLVGVLLAAEAWTSGTLTLGSHVFTQGDSLHIELLLNLSDTKAGNAEAYLFTPVLRGAAGRLQELPAVVVSGRRRARADHRQQTLQPSPGYLPPYRTLYDRNRKDSIVYKVSVAYSPWMEHASLVLMSERRDCCRMKMLGVEPVITDLALTSPFHVPQGQISVSQRQMAVSQGQAVNLPEQTAIPQAVTERHENAANRQETQSRSDCMPCTECTAMVTYLTPDMETQKHRSESATLYIDYPTGVYDVRREFHNNRPELEKLDSLMRPLTEGNLANISSISICGYASPDGTYKDNEILASNRARCFKEYMRATYAPGHDLYKVSSVPEDWDGLVDLLQQRPMNHSDEVLSLITRTGIFEGREKQLMDMHGGTVYRELLKSYFPQLRRIRITVGYEARAFNIEEAASLIYTHPRLLSLQEMYRVAAFYRPGTEQYREVYEIAAYHFPDDVLANINAASAVIMAGDPVTARQYLNKVADDPRAWNDFGVLAYLEGDREKAEEWFRKALGIEPEKARKNLKKIKNGK